MDDLGLVDAVDGLGQSVVIAVPAAADRGLDAGLGQPFAIANADVLRSPIRVMDERAIPVGLPGSAASALTS
jgi:hypothetical protein